MTKSYSLSEENVITTHVERPHSPWSHCVWENQREHTLVQLAKVWMGEELKGVTERSTRTGTAHGTTSHPTASVLYNDRKHRGKDAHSLVKSHVSSHVWETFQCQVVSDFRCDAHSIHLQWAVSRSAPKTSRGIQENSETPNQRPPLVEDCILTNSSIHTTPSNHYHHWLCSFDYFMIFKVTFEQGFTAQIKKGKWKMLCKGKSEK